MNELRFEWDPSKAAGNSAKHGVSFDEAVSVFYDECAVEFYDDTHSAWEDRLLLVCHCHREGTGTIRLISARKATKLEATHYHR